MKCKRFMGMLMAGLITCSTVVSVPALASSLDKTVEALSETAEEAAAELEETVNEAGETLDGLTDEEAPFADMLNGEVEGKLDLEETPFKDFLYRELDKDLENVGDQYEKYLENLELAMKGSSSSMELTLEDAGKSLLGMMMPIDLSWLNSVFMKTDATIQDTTEAVSNVLGVNGQDIVTVLTQVDFSDLSCLMSIPELAQGWLKGDFTVTMTLDTSDSAMPQMLSMQLLPGIIANLPDRDTFVTLLRRYTEPLLDAFAEGGVEKDEMKVFDLSEEVDVVTGLLNAKETLDAVRQIFEMAKEDPDLKEIIGSLDEDGTAYTLFQNMLDGALESMEEAPEEGDPIKVSFLLDQTGEAVGYEVELPTGRGYERVQSGYQLQAEDETESYLDLNMGGMALAVTAELKGPEGAKEGYCDLYLGDKNIACIDISDYDWNGEDCKFSGKFKIYVPQQDENEVENDELAATLAGLSLYELTADVSSEGTESTMDLGLNMAGSPLAVLHMESGLGDGVEIVDPSTLTDVYDMNSEEDMISFGASLDLSGLLEKLANSGVAEDAINMILLSMGMTGEE